MTIVIALGGNALLRRGDRRPEGVWRRWSPLLVLATAGAPADEPALGYSGYFGLGRPVCLTGEVACVPGGQRICRGTVCDDAEHHGDRDDSGGMIGSRIAQFLQGKQAEHHRGQAAGTEPGHQGDRGPV
jgi:hypothetical protein